MTQAPLSLKNFYPSQINFMAATIAIMENVSQIRIVCTF